MEANATAELQVVRLSVDTYGSRFGIVMDIPGSAILRRTPLRLTGRVTETAETVVLTRSLQRGEIVRQADIAIERRPRAEVTKDGIGQLAQAIGLAPRRPTRAGHALRQADLMKPELVQRDETVTLVYEVPGVLLTIRGKAMEAGAEGDVIGVLNLQSKRTVQGTGRSRDMKEDSGISNFFGKTKLPILNAVLPTRIFTGDSTSATDGKGTINRSEALQTNVARVVTQVLPNGNLVIEGKQEVWVNFEVRELIVAGIVRPEDIESDNTIESIEIAEARIAYGGRGQITDVQQARYGQQVLDVILPF